MTDRKLTLADVVRDAMDARLQRVHVCLPGVVESYDNQTQTISAKVAIKKVNNFTEIRTTGEYPVIPNVPVVFPRGGGFFCSFPLQKGDSVLLVFSERAIDNWYLEGEGKDPEIDRMHDLADAYAIPGGYPEPEKLGDTDDTHMVMGKEGGKKIQIESGGVKLGDVGATRGVAREDDKTSADTSMNTWISQVSTAINQVAAILNVTPPAPVTSAAGSVTPVAPATPLDFGYISTSSGTVKSE